MNATADRLACALAAIDRANADDPRRVTAGERELPHEQLYAERMTATLARIAPHAGELLQIAARAQHVRRWTVPRSAYPEGRAGYRRWRTELGRFHAATAATLARGCGYDAAEVARLESLLRKEGLPEDSECQLLEDCACLVFMEHYLADFATGREPAQLRLILRKTWNKMSATGRKHASELQLPPALGALVDAALAGGTRP